MRGLPFWYEDDHAIYVHAGPAARADGFLHPSKAPAPAALLWLRDEDFFRNYRGKLVVFGHTATAYLPPELSTYTPAGPARHLGRPLLRRASTRARQGRLSHRASSCRR